MPDTLVIDSAQIAQWQAQNDFDYNRELAGGGMSFTEWLMMQLRELFFGDVVGSTLANWLLTLLAIAVLGIIAWYLWRYHPGLFRRQEQLLSDYDDSEDNIYGVDFDAAIARSLSREDYREAIRLCYLQTLKALTDAHLIDWQLFKTPTQYVRELNASSLGSDGAAAKTAFRTLTTHFLRVRYGNFPATRPLYDEVEALRKEVARES